MEGRIRDLVSRLPMGRSAIGVLQELRLIRRTISGATSGLGLPLNGQVARMRALRALINSFSPGAVIETGTFLGDTARFFCGNLIPVYTIEVKRLFHLVAKWRLRSVPELTLLRGHSTDVLRDLARSRPIEKPLVYLDAHWWDHLPLQAEVGEVIAAWEDVVIVIDDVQVPTDPGYGFDTYRGVPLSLGLLDLPATSVCAFPATSSSMETGGKRGALYIASGRSAIRALHELADQGLVVFVAADGVAGSGDK